MATRKVEVAIVGDASSLVRAFRTADRSASSFGKGGSKMGAVGMGLLAGGAAGAALAISQGLSAALQTGISEFSEAQKVSAQTAAAIKSTGGAAGVTKKHIEDMASAMQESTGLEDDLVQSSQNLLLTFTKISNRGPDKIFDRATKAAADLSVALNKDMNSSAMMVGKALNDPVKGISALGRAGVQFTSSQKATIKSLVETGRVADAQKMILKELETQVGGSAKAFGNTTPGQIEKAKRAFEDMTQGVVAAVVPLVNAVLPYLTAAIRGVTTFFQNNWPKIQQVAQQVWTWFSTNLLPGFVEVGKAMGDMVTSVVGFFRTYWPQIWAIAGPIINQLVNVVRTGMQMVVGIVKLVSSVLKGDWGGVWSAMKGLVANAVTGMLSTVKNLGSLLWGVMKAAGLAAWNGIKAGAAAIGGFAMWVMQKIGQSIAELASNAYNRMKAVGLAVWNGIKAGAAAISAFPAWLLGKLAGMIAGFVSWVKGAFYAIGGAIVEGIKAGVNALWPGLLGFLADKLGFLPEPVKKVLGIGSPSRVFADQVGAPIMQGVEMGIRKAAPKAQATLVSVMKSAVASAKSNALSLASSFGGLFAQAATAGDTSRLAGLESGLSKDQEARQEGALKRAIAEAKAEESAKQAAISGAEDAAQAQRDYDNAVQSRLDAEAQLSDFYRQKEINDLRESVSARQTQYQKDIDNLAAQFARGEISADDFNTALNALLGGETGASLGSAFALQYSLALDALKTQLTEIAAISGQAGVMPSGPSVERPRQTWNDAIDSVRSSLESQWEKAHPKGNVNSKAAKQWIADRLERWKKANAAKYGVALAAGGIVTGPTNALVGEAGREAVIPLDGARAKKMLSAAGVAGQPVVNLTFNGVMNAKDAARMLRPELDRLVRLAV